MIQVKFISQNIDLNEVFFQFPIQGVLLCPQTLSQVRRTELQRAFTEATTDTLTYAKTVSDP